MASLMALTLNLHRSKSDAPVSPSQLHPYRSQKTEVETKSSEEHTLRRVNLLPPALREKVLAKMEQRDGRNR